MAGMSTPKLRSFSEEVRRCERLELGACAYLAVACGVTSHVWPWSRGTDSSAHEPLMFGVLAGIMLSLAWAVYLSLGSYHAKALESKPKPAIMVAQRQAVFVITMATVVCAGTLFARFDESLRSSGPALLIMLVPFFGALVGKVAAELFIADQHDDSVTLSREEYDRLWTAAKAAERGASPQ